MCNSSDVILLKSYSFRSKLTACKFYCKFTLTIESIPVKLEVKCLILDVVHLQLHLTTPFDPYW